MKFLVQLLISFVIHGTLIYLMWDEIGFFTRIWAIVISFLILSQNANDTARTELEQIRKKIEKLKSELKSL